MRSSRVRTYVRVHRPACPGDARCAAASRLRVAATRRAPARADRAADRVAGGADQCRLRPLAGAGRRVRPSRGLGRDRLSLDLRVGRVALRAHAASGARARAGGEGAGRVARDRKGIRRRRAELLEGARPDAGRRRRRRGRADRARPPRHRRPARAHGARRAALHRGRCRRGPARELRALVLGRRGRLPAHRRQAAAGGRRTGLARARGCPGRDSRRASRRGRRTPGRFRGTACCHRAERFRGTASRRLTQQRRVARRARRGGARPAAGRHGGRRALPGLRARRRRDPGHGLARGERDGTGRVRDCRRAGDRARDRPPPGVRLLLRFPRRAGRQTAQRRAAHALDPAGDPPRARRTRRPLSVSRLRAKTIRRCAPHPPLGPRRRDRPRQPRAALPPSSSARPRGRLLGRARRRGPTALQGSG